jgi:hypothetical protein
MAPNDDFDDLRKLLALKRHEQPPPGYFNKFSDQVIARITAAEQAVEVPSWKRWLNRLEASPLMTCAYGAAVGCLLIAGVHWAAQIEQQAVVAPAEAPEFLVTLPTAAPLADEPSLAGFEAPLTDDFPTLTSTSGPPASMFRPASAQRVNFQP